MITKKQNSRLTQVLDKELGPFSFGSFLRAARTTRDVSQVEMARWLGVSKSTLCGLEKGRQFVTPALAAKIARKCGLSELVAVEAALTDQVRRAKLKMRVQVNPDADAA